MVENIKFKDVEQITKDIFKESFVAVLQIKSDVIRHIYIKHNLSGEQIIELQKFYKIVFVAQVYEEEREQMNFDAIQVILVNELEGENI